MDADDEPNFVQTTFEWVDADACNESNTFQVVDGCFDTWRNFDEDRYLSAQPCVELDVDAGDDTNSAPSFVSKLDVDADDGSNTIQNPGFELDAHAGHDVRALLSADTRSESDVDTHSDKADHSYSISVSDFDTDPGACVSEARSAFFVGVPDTDPNHEPQALTDAYSNAHAGSCDDVWPVLPENVDRERNAISCAIEGCDSSSSVVGWFDISSSHDKTKECDDGIVVDIGAGHEPKTFQTAFSEPSVDSGYDTHSLSFVERQSCFVTVGQETWYQEFECAAGSVSKLPDQYYAYRYRACYHNASDDCDEPSQCHSRS